ncbi:hypothetical protein Clacol_006578 [Clathrus columnatus]|uniref:CCHC-type domain-containing protein n=1 Tax=Clathrus columnatus TaxID=1419009 RepID=A0AAV5AF21_9AGAM|nr:hypothetical protein Clacol_006578 [Clathrus columnatus]
MPTAKIELGKVKETHPFTLDIIDIHSEQGRPWKEKYAWWIPVLHLEGKEIAKGRWNQHVAVDSISYSRDVSLILGEGVSAEESPKPVPFFLRDRRVPRCFNCGDEKHMVSSCPLPHNYSLISLSRTMYDFFQQNIGKREYERIHEYAERMSKRKCYNNVFEPGKLGQDVLNALDFQEDDDLTRLPWYFRMLEWGYPPGWVSVENPKDKVNARIQNEDTTDDVETVCIFSSASPSSEGEESDEDIIEQYHAIREKSNDMPKRWATYPTTLFSSERLTIYTGKRLPIDMYITSSERIPPWRHPDAFGAFGPVGWQGVVKTYDTRINDGPGECEMDLSD